MKQTLHLLALAVLLCIPWTGNAQTYFSEDFNSRPTGWTGGSLDVQQAFAGTTFTPTGSPSWTYQNSNYDGLEAGFYYFEYGSIKYRWMITPSIDLTGATTAQVSFDLALTKYNSTEAPGGFSNDEQFMVIVSTDNGATWSETNATTWLSAGGNYNIAAIPTTWQTYTVNLSAYVGNTIKIAFYTQKATSGYLNNIHLDNVVVEEVPGCFAVNQVSVAEGALARNSVQLTWVDMYNSGATYVVKNGDDVVAGPTAAGATQCLVSGLLSNTVYTLTVHAICDGGAESQGKSITFRTACGIDALPWTEDFEDVPTSNSYEMPYCWTRIGSNTYPYSYNTTYAHGGRRSLHGYIGASDNGQRLGVMPQIDVDNLPLSTLRLRFWARSSSSGYCKIIVGTMNDPTDVATFTEVQTIEIVAGNYQQYTVQNFTDNGDSYIAFRIDGNGKDQTYYIDDVTLDLAPACREVANLKVSAISSNSVSLSWTPITAGASYIVKNGDETLATTNADAAGCTIAGLDPNTNYTLSVYTLCGGTPSEEAIDISFITLCDGLPLPFSENFDSYSTNFRPLCWRAFGDNTNCVTSSTYYHSYNRSLRFNSTVGYVNPVFIMPPFESEVNTTQLNFFYGSASTGDAYGNLQVGYVTNVADTSTFVPLKQFSPSSTYTEVRMSMAQAPDGALIAFRILSKNTGSTGSWYLDDFSVEEKAGCMVPSDVTVSNIAGSSVILHWKDNNNGAVSYRITDGSNVLVAATSVGATSCTVPGLTPNTNYKLYVMANCAGDATSDADSVSFTTDCDPAAVPYFEGFESTELEEMPDCWRVYKQGSSLSAYSSYAHSGSRSLRSYNSTNNIVVLPPMNVPTNTLEIHLWVRMQGNPSYVNQTFRIGYMGDLDDTTTFTPIEEYTLSSDGVYKEYLVQLSDAPTDARIAIQHAGEYFCYIDDISVEPINNCIRVTGAGHDNTKSHSARIYWTDNNNGDDVTYTVKNGEEVLGTTVPGVHSLTITSLTANTTYADLTVTANCSASEHSYPVKVPSFATYSDETDILAFDITTDGIRRGDAVIDHDQHTVTMPIYYTTDFSNASGSISLSSGAQLYVVNDNGYEYSIYNSYSLAASNLRSYLAQDTVLTLRVEAQDREIVTDWSLILEREECTSPRNMRLTPSTSTIDVNWDMPDPDVSQYEIVYSTTPMDEEALNGAEKIAFNGVMHQLIGLDRETRYYVYLRSSCDAGSYSSWVSADTKTLYLKGNCEVLATVGDESSTRSQHYTPLNTYYKYSFTETIIDASEIGNTPAQLDGIGFYYADGQDDLTVKTDVTLWIQPTSKTTFSGSNDYEELNPATAVKVYSGPFYMQSGWNDIDFTERFSFDGTSNLMLIVDDNSGQYNSNPKFVTTASTGQKNLAWYSDSQNPDINNLSSYTGDNKYVYSERANMRFKTCEPGIACPTVSEIEASGIRYNGATIAWTASEGDYVGSYDVFASATQLDAAALDAYAGPYAYQGSETSCQVTGLTELTDYYVYVRTVCNGFGHDDGTSTWAEGSFTTAAGCYPPMNSTVEMVGKNRVALTWESGDPDQEQSSNYSYVLSTSILDIATLNSMTHDADGYAATSITISDLLYGTGYHFYVQNSCGVDMNSPWVDIPFSTYDTMPAVVNITATDIEAHWFTAGWEVNSAMFANETSWQYAVVPTGETPSQWTLTEATSNLVYGLAANTTYDFYVRPYDEENALAGTETFVTVTTAGESAPCAIAAQSEGSITQYAPVYGYWADNAQRVQSVYPAKMLEAYLGKTITSMHYFVQDGNNSNWNNSTFIVSLGITDKENLSSGMDNSTPLTVYYTGTLTANESDGMTIILDQPFTYTGGNLLVQFEEPVKSGYNAVYFYGLDYSGGSRFTRTGSESSTIDNHLPMLQLCYEADASCNDMMDITVSNVTTDGAQINWMPGGAETEWQYLLTAGPTAEAERAGQAQSIYDLKYDLESLEADMDYFFYIRSVCAENSFGPWAQRSFQTVATCSRPYNLHTSNVGTRSAQLDANAGEIGTATAMTFRYWADGSEDTTTVDGIHYSYHNYYYADITNLEPNTDYLFQAMTTCSVDEGNSRWCAPVRFTTKLEPLSLENDRIYTFDEEQRKDWVFVNGDEINKWSIGTAAAKTANGRGLYISNDGGSTNAYTQELAGSSVYAYSAFTFEQGKQYIVDFQWKNVGESNDNLRAWLVPDSYDFTAGIVYGTTSEWIDLTGNTALYNSDTWQRRVNNFFDGDLEGDYKLLFLWTNNNNSGANPPAAIDSVVVRERERYTVNATVNSDAENTPLGTIEGDTGTMYVTTPIFLTASDAPYGYFFAGWYTGTDYATQIRPDYSIAFTLSADTNLLARYDSITFVTNAVVATPPVEPSEVRGTVSPASISAKFNLPVTFTATPATGYHLVGWTDDTDAPAGASETLTVQAYRDNTYTATFDTNEYTVTVTTDNSAMGSALTDAATVKHFLSTQLSATPLYGYHFNGWVNNSGVFVSTDNPLTLSPVSDTALKATFLPNQYTVTAATANAVMGSADGTATVDYLSFVTLNATNNYGYHFVGWTNADGDTIGFDPTIQVQALRDSVITANFDFNQYTVTGTSADEAMGSVEGTATVNYLTDVTLIATANYGYHFVNWTNAAGDILGTTPTITVQALRDSSLTANFDYNQYTVTGMPEHDYMGTVDGTATVNYRSSVTLSAMPATGYHFVNWTNAANDTLGTEATLDVQALRDSVITAHFDTNVYSVTANIVSDGMGSVMGAVEAKHFLSTTLVATANYGYHFINWTDELGAELGTDASLVVWPTSDLTVNANFDYNQYTVTGLSADETMGSVSGTTMVNYLSEVVLTATPANGHHFVQWNDGNTDNPRTVVATWDSTLTASFAITPAELAWSANTFTGYTHIDFNNWAPTLVNPHNVNVRYGCAEGGIAVNEVAGGVVSMGAVTAAGTYHIYAVHETDETYYYDSVVYTLTVLPSVMVTLQKTIDEGGTVSIPEAVEPTLTSSYTVLDGAPSVYLAPGESARFLAEPETGYHFNGWMNGNELESAEADYSYVAPIDISTFATESLHMLILKAAFDTNVYNIVANVADASVGMGTATVTGRHMHFLTDIVEAFPNDDCHFVQWSDGNTDNPRTVEVTGDAEYSAIFAYNQHIVTLAVNDPAMGTVSGDGTFPTFSEVAVEATPAEHYHFLYWQQGSTTISDNPYNFTLEEDVDLTAVFAIDEHTVSVAVENGTVTGQGQYAYGSSVTLVAEPVSLCYHFDGWMVDGQVVSTDEQYTFTLASDVDLTASFARTNYDGVETVTACDSYVWHGVEYSESNNTATFNSLTVNGCDSTTTLNLTLNRSAEAHLYVNACESYTWNYVRRTHSGIFSQHTQTAAGCDSLTTLHLTINHANSAVETITACDSYTWHGVEYTESNNTATFQTRNVAGCDSVVTLDLTVNYSTVAVETVAACDSYTWIDGQTYTASTSEPVFVATNAVGCDSIVTLDLAVNTSTSGTESVTACDTYLWNGQTLTESGNYTASLTNADGCDSTATLALTINHSTTSVETVSACDSYTWHGVAYTESNNTATYTSQDANGCDVVTTLHLTVNHSVATTETVSACDSYTWHGAVYTASNNTATYFTTTIDGCDSTVTLNLTVMPTLELTETVTACDNYTWHGVVYTESNNTATYTSQDANGCDVVTTLHLTVNHNVAATETVFACDSYTWHGIVYTASNNTATYSTTTIDGCDSTVTLNLTLGTATSSTETATACDSYIWHDNDLVSSNTYSYTTTNASGCDSTVVLHLTINHSNFADETVTACDSYHWNGVEYTSSTVATYTTANAAGCDSTTTLFLTLNASSDTLFEATACDSYLWDDSILTESGETSMVFANAAGCDSTVTLSLTINLSTSAIDEVVTTDSFIWIDGQTYTASTDTPSVILTNAAGCDSTVTLHLTIVSVPVYNVTVLTADTTMGTVAPEGVVALAEGSSFTATATALPGRHFVGWTRVPDNDVMITDNPYIFTVDSDVTLTAVFDYDDVTATLTVNDATMGTTDPQPGTYTFHVGDTAHVRATANSGYVFAGWKVNDIMLDVVDNEVAIAVTAEMAGQTFAVEAVFDVFNGIADVDAAAATITVEGTRIIVLGGEGNTVDIYDAVGRRVRHTVANAQKVEIDVNASGVYLVKMGNAPAKRIAVVR